MDGYTTETVAHGQCNASLRLHSHLHNIAAFGQYQIILPDNNRGTCVSELPRGIMLH